MRHGSWVFWVVAGSLAAGHGCSGSSGAEDVADQVAEDAEATGEVVADADAEASAETGPDVVEDIVEEVGPDAVVDAGPDAVEDFGDGEAEADAPPSAAPECASAEECTLHTDCCNCLALAPGEDPPPCDRTECFVTTCTPRGITDDDVVCAAGRCAAGYDCDESRVACLAPTPICPAGEVPSVSGLCWGPCVPADECAYVTDCARCDGATHFCATYVQRSGPVRYCVRRFDACGGIADCACEGPGVCVGPFDACAEEEESGPVCSCPVCD